MEKWIEAGKIAGEALEYGRSLIKEDVSILEVADKVEAKILELGAKPAFPVNISINEVAAHVIPKYNDESRIKKDDMVKLDVGVHIDGFIGDTALTIDLGSNPELVKASQEALEEAIKITQIGTKINEIGRVIQEVIQSYGFSPIKNLSGHSIEKYIQHAGMTIPNFDNGNKMELKKNQIIAIEPFATNGMGAIFEGKQSGIYKLENVKNIRNMTAREVLGFIIDEYKELPFAKRWLIKKFGLKAGLALNTLEREKIIYQFSELPEKNKGLVSQAEHTLLIQDKVQVLTKI